MKNFFLEEILNKKRGKKYDAVVMYSGGKDSAYLLYLLQQEYHLRVLAVIVDNGYENDYLWKSMSQYAENLGIPVEIIRPDKEIFRQLFHMLIVEQDFFKRDGVNHICFICNNLLWCCVSKYATENQIPYVISGLSLAQLNSGRNVPLVPEKMANTIAERSTRIIFRNAVTNMEKTVTYHESVLLQKFIAELQTGVKEVITVYPYIYHIISVEQVKSKLLELGWQTPNAVAVDKYISSGCKIMRRVIYELEKLGIVTINEREQVKAMVKDELLPQTRLEYAYYDASKESVNLSDDLMQELNIKEYLYRLCEETNREVIV